MHNRPGQRCRYRPGRFALRSEAGLDGITRSGLNTTHLSLGPSTEPRVDSDIQSETTLEPRFRILMHNNVDAVPNNSVALFTWLTVEWKRSRITTASRPTFTSNCRAVSCGRALGYIDFQKTGGTISLIWNFFFNRGVWITCWKF